MLLVSSPLFHSVNMPHDATPEKLRIAIVGGGIGGLTLASALNHHGGDNPSFEVDLYEGESIISEIGAGINLWPRTWEVMGSLGLAEELRPFLTGPLDDTPRTVFRVHKADQPRGIFIRDIVMKGGAARFHRGDLQQVLLRHLRGRLHLSHRLISFEEHEDEVRLYFMNGTVAVCDVLIGMDGIRSVVRRGFLQRQGFLKSPSVDPIWTGTIAYRGMIAKETLEAVYPNHRAATEPMLYVGKLKHLIVYQVTKSEHTLINIAAFVTDPAEEGTRLPGSPSMPCSQREMLAPFEGWDNEVQALLNCIEKPTKWLIRHLYPLERYASGRVILCGDAAHAMSPHHGAGAGQAIEDAYVLSSLLCHDLASKDTIPQIAEIYNAIRYPQGNKTLLGSDQAGKQTQLVAPGFEDVREGDADVPLEKLQDLFEDFARRWDWVWKESAEGDRSLALQLFKSPETFQRPRPYSACMLSGRL
ncbi:hypothetical protein D9619_010218 [Psilocybe cf. subviscida]|uniref:FAD-binding domain-containing protein n=1 Tax=Psilocybe cf. subviscida TaxID=2480587 RepID=A0A8H5ERZ6_9AGAR|nr:hypothetical protein D9619_010218 [Psilocybe cf. subviscida]